jgi:hypothetical protein
MALRTVNKEVQFPMRILGTKTLGGMVVALLSVASLGLASWGIHKSKSTERGTSVTIVDTLQLKNGSTLPAGDYRMDVAENTKTPDVSFYKDGKVIATTRATVVAEQKKNSETEVDYVKKGGANRLTEIRPSGWYKALLFTPGGQGGSASAGSSGR